MPSNYEIFLQIQKQMEKQQESKFTRQKLETRFNNKIIKQWQSINDQPITKNGKIKTSREIIKSFSKNVSDYSSRFLLNRIVGMWIAQIYYDNNFEVAFKKKVNGSFIDIIVSNKESTRYFIIETEFRKPEKLIRKLLSIRVFPLALVIPKKVPTLKRLIPTVKSIPSILKLYDIEVVFAPYYLSNKNLPNGFEVIDFKSLPSQEFNELVDEKEFAELNELKNREEQIQKTLNKKKQDTQNKIKFLNRELFVEDEIKKRINYCRIWNRREEMWKVVQFFAELPNFSFKVIKKFDISVMLDGRELCVIRTSKQGWTASINSDGFRNYTPLSLIENCIESIGGILPEEVKRNLDTDLPIKKLTNGVELKELNPKLESKKLINPNLVKNKNARKELQDTLWELLKIDGITVNKAGYYNFSVKFYGTTILRISQLRKEWSAFFKGERTRRYSKERLLETVNKIIKPNRYV